MGVEYGGHRVRQMHRACDIVGGTMQKGRNDSRQIYEG